MSNILKLILINLVTILLSIFGSYLTILIAKNIFFLSVGKCPIPIDQIGLPLDYRPPKCIGLILWYWKNELMIELIFGTVFLVIFYLIIRKLIGKLIK